MKRVSFLAGASALPAFLLPLSTPAAGDFHGAIAELETKSGGRLGVAIVDTGTGATKTYRGGERFAMCSTFKLLAVAAALHRVDAGSESLDRRVPYGKSDLQEYAPVARQHLSEGFMTVGALIDAAIVYSDNTAANLLVASAGGPPSVTRYARSLGDTVTRLDRVEPELNTGIPGDPRDTTSPLSMARDAQKLLLGDALSVASRQRLIDWLVRSQTGMDLIRAGIRSTWRVGDKTGLGGRHNAHGDSDTRNDVAIVWPPHRAPFIVSVYLTGSQLPAQQRDATLASVGRIAAEELT